jgi:predicted transcriptional regulator
MRGLFFGSDKPTKARRGRVSLLRGVFAISPLGLIFRASDEGEEVVAPAEKTAKCERLAALDASIRGGLADAEAGRTKPAEQVFDRLEGKYRDLAGR